jgi:hypothetical protein
VAIIVMDYANRRRLKLLGHLTFVAVPDAEPDLVRQVELPGYRARVERVALTDIVAFDWNCRSTSRYGSRKRKWPPRRSRCATGWRSSRRVSRRRGPDADASHPARHSGFRLSPRASPRPGQSAVRRLRLERSHRAAYDAS